MAVKDSRVVSEGCLTGSESHLTPPSKLAEACKPAVPQGPSLAHQPNARPRTATGVSCQLARYTAGSEGCGEAVSKPWQDGRLDKCPSSSQRPPHDRHPGAAHATRRSCISSHRSPLPKLPRPMVRSMVRSQKLSSNGWMSASFGDCTSLLLLLWRCLLSGAPKAGTPGASATAAGGVAGVTVAAVALLALLRSVLALPGEGVTWATIHDNSWSERTNSLLRGGQANRGSCFQRCAWRQCCFQSQQACGPGPASATPVSQSAM